MDEMTRLNEYGELWDGWVVDKLLYEGNLSNVYQVKNGNSTGIIKVVSIPKIQSDNRSVDRSAGETKEAHNAYYKEVVDVLQRELESLECLKEIPNVLGYRKYEAFERTESIGYDYVLLMDKEQSLLEYIAERKIKNADIVRIIKEVAWILERAHKEGIIHKDIKPENIFMAENGESMLADFSIARKIESFQSRSKRRTDSIFMAPEVMSEYDYNETTDVYALGMVFYLLLNNGNIPIECARRNFKTQVPNPERAKDKLSEIVLKAISYRAKDRYQSADEFFQVLCHLQEEDLEFPQNYDESEEERRRKLEEEERLRREEEERKAEEERIRKEEEEQKAEEERIRKEEEERKAEEERIRKEEEEQKKAQLIRIAEEERKREEEKRLRTEKERKKEVAFISTPTSGEVSLESATIELDNAIEDMKQISKEADEKKAKLSKVDQDASIPKEIAKISVEDIERLEKNNRKIENALERSEELLKRLTEQEASNVKLHSDESEYSGFFNFSETEEYEAKKKEMNYDKSVEEEPYEQKLTNAVKVKKRGKSLLIVAMLLLIIGAGIFVYNDDVAKEKVQTIYNGALDYLDEKGIINKSELKNESDSQQQEIYEDIRVMTNEHIVERREKNINDLSELGSINHVTELYLTNNNIKHIEPLSELHSLEILDISYNYVKDFTVLKQLSSLRSLNVAFSTLEDISTLKECEQLTYLYLNDNDISNVAALKKLKNMKILMLQNNNIKDISALENMSELVYLDISGNAEIKDISALGKLKRLKSLNLAGIGASEKDIEKLQKKLPDCVITVK